jgi:hypothetical protein
MEIVRGDRLMARTATGERVPRRAVSGVEQGDLFPVVWVCEEREYGRAQQEGREPKRVPWPANAVEKIPA